MDYISIIGTVGATLTTISQLPQLVKVWQTKQTKDLSLPTYAVLATGVALWVAYGFLLHEPPIYIANIFTEIVVCSVLALKVKYG